MLSWHLDRKITFSLQYDKSLAIVFPTLVLKLSENLPKHGKKELNTINFMSLCC